RHHRAGARLARHFDRRLEIDFLAPGHGRGVDRQRGRDGLCGRRIEKLGLERQGPEVETDAFGQELSPRFEELVTTLTQVYNPGRGIMGWAACRSCNQRPASSRSWRSPG